MPFIIKLRNLYILTEEKELSHTEKYGSNLVLQQGMNVSEKQKLPEA